MDAKEVADKTWTEQNPEEVQKHKEKGIRHRFLTKTIRTDGNRFVYL